MTVATAAKIWVCGDQVHLTQTCFTHSLFYPFSLYYNTHTHTQTAPIGALRGRLGALPLEEMRQREPVQRLGQRHELVAAGGASEHRALEHPNPNLT